MHVGMSSQRYRNGGHVSRGLELGSEWIAVGGVIRQSGGSSAKTRRGQSPAARIWQHVPGTGKDQGPADRWQISSGEANFDARNLSSHPVAAGLDANTCID